MPTDALKRAKRGDRAAFDRLIAGELPKLRRITRRLVGHPDDADDVLQDSLMKAWRALPDFDERAAFTTWLTAILTRTAVDHLRAQKRWRAGAQVAYANQCATDESLSSEVMAAASTPDFDFEVREHIAYCFACVARSLPPDEQAALVLRDILDMSAREASTVLGISDSVLRHRLSAARSTMTECYEGLCALVSKTGICHQCRGLSALSPAEKPPAPFPDVSTLANRMAVVRNAEPGSMQELHAVFWRRTKEIEEEGRGSTFPLSGCGEDDDDEETCTS